MTKGNINYFLKLFCSILRKDDVYNNLNTEYPMFLVFFYAFYEMNVSAVINDVSFGKDQCRNRYVTFKL